MKELIVALVLGLLLGTGIIYFSSQANATKSITEVERSGCCSHHNGVCGCSNGRTICCDGTLSPSCTCY